MPGEDSTRVVLVHGLEGGKAGEHVLATASGYSQAGYGVLMFDLRGTASPRGSGPRWVIRRCGTY